MSICKCGHNSIFHTWKDDCEICLKQFRRLGLSFKDKEQFLEYLEQQTTFGNRIGCVNPKRVLDN